MSDDLDIDVLMRTPAWESAVTGAAALVRKAATAAWDRAGPTGAEGCPAELAVVLADDALVRRLNHDYRGQDRPTNVLSFPSEEPGLLASAAAPRMLGDVVLALETVLAEAAAQGKSPADHLAHLVLHGALHLLGYDHESPDDAAAMEALEVELLAGIGVADPYADRDAMAGGRP